MKEESTFIDWQRAKVQETTDEVRPAHHFPASSQQCLLHYMLQESMRKQMPDRVT